jgi:hypothetical protein
MTMKKILHIFSLFLDLPLAALIFYCAFKFAIFQREYWQHPYFDFFLAETFYSESNFPFTDRFTAAPMKSEILPLEWEINKNEITSLDTHHIAIRSKVTYYAWVRDFSENYWINTVYVLFNNDNPDTLVDGMGCGTGTFLNKIHTDETVEWSQWNPLLWSPLFYDGLDPSNDSLPQYFKESYGDSLEIYWSIITYSPPWSDFPPQTVNSPSIIISIDEVISEWKKRQY